MAYKTVEDYTGSTVIGHRSTRRNAEKMIASYSDLVGESSVWNGQESLPVLVTMDVVKVASNWFDVVQTITAPVSEEQAALDADTARRESVEGHHRSMAARVLAERERGEFWG